MFKIGWFSTGRDRAAIDLLDVVLQAIEDGTIPDSKIVWVFCNREKGEKKTTERFIKFVEEKDIPLICRSSSKFKPELRKKDIEVWRKAFDESILDALKEQEEPDIVVFAGYMLIVSEKLCNAFPIINLHPALPGGPKGSWQEVIREYMEKEAKQIGAMMHLVTKELDAGPPVTFCRIPVKELDFHQMREEELKREFPLIIQTLKGLSEGRFEIEEEPLELTEEVEESLRREL